jgi:homocysteine S-methyltransferase
MAERDPRAINSDAACGFRTRLSEARPVILDGALGTLLESRGIACTLPLWSAHALLEAPDVIEAIHREYQAAGCEILTANTFRTQRRALSRGGIGDRAFELTALAVELAKRASAHAPRRCWVAGSAPPLEDCYRPDRVPGDSELAAEHDDHARNLARAGVDLILAETQIKVREARAAAAAAHRTGLPFGVSFVCGADSRLLSGESLEEALAAISEYEPSFVAVNCLPPRDASASLEALLAACDRLALDWPLGVYPNLGNPGPGGSRHASSPTELAEASSQWVRRGARIVGGCCGTNPEFTRALVARIREDFA